MKFFNERVFRWVLIICIIGYSICMISCTSTPKIRSGIAEIRSITIGSIKQTILIRGENLGNPILLYLHGGPGSTEMIPFRLAHKNLEKYFTVVSWEQRGTGRSFSDDISPDSMTIDQFVSDTHELTGYLIKEFGKSKIVLAGHSWGTILGLLTVSKYPNDYYAYVGSGQEVNPAEGEKIGYEYILAKANNNKKALDELQKINMGESYLTMDNTGDWYNKIKIERKWLVAFGGEIYNKKDYSLLFSSKTMFAPEYSFIDFIKFGRGSVFSLKTMWPQIMKINLREQVKKVEIPVFFLQGRNDYNAPTSILNEYYSLLEAPEKEIFYFENSAHHPMYEEPDKYEKILIENILPLCK